MNLRHARVCVNPLFASKAVTQLNPMNPKRFSHCVSCVTLYTHCLTQCGCNRALGEM